MLLSSRILIFSVGFVIGVWLYFFINTPSNELPIRKQHELYKDIYRIQYEDWLREKGIIVQKANLDDLSYAKNRSELKKYLESKLLFDLIHVTCVVFVNRQKNAYLIDSTWGNKCNDIIYYNTAKDDYIKTYVIPFVNKWQYLCESIQHLWSKSKTLEWILFSPDDVFVIPENLRYFVATKDFNKPYYFGHKVVFWKQIFNSDKTSYILSYGAIKALMGKFNSSSVCRESKHVNNAVYNLGKHLSELGIHAGDSRDYKGRDRFHIFTLRQLVAEGNPEVISRNSKTSVHQVVQGKDCCSDTSISFRSTQNDETVFINYLLYKVSVFNSGNAANRPKDESDTKEVIYFFSYFSLCIRNFLIYIFHT